MLIYIIHITFRDIHISIPYAPWCWYICLHLGDLANVGSHIPAPWSIWVYIYIYKYSIMNPNWEWLMAFLSFQVLAWMKNPLSRRQVSPKDLERRDSVAEP